MDYYIVHHNWTSLYNTPRISLESRLERVGTIISGGDERIYNFVSKRHILTYKRI